MSMNVSNVGVSLVSNPTGEDSVELNKKANSEIYDI